jgi:endonuclease G
LKSNRSIPALLLLSLLPGVFDAEATIDASLQMQLGKPSGATTDTNNHDHYLIQRLVEALDYSDHLGEPVWASWDLTSGDVGSATRSPNFFTDTTLPAGFYRVTTTDYNGVGVIDFNRGHLCPSEDRTDTRQDNDLVFFMSNIMPQSGPNNQGVWVNLESYCRTLADAGNELLIICGPSGFGTNTIPSGKAYIASNVWKIIVSVPLGSGTALSRMTATNRVIAVSIPNVTNGLSSAWQTYVTSPGQIERETGFTFFTTLPPDIASAFRSRVDGTSYVPIISNALATNGQFKFTVNGSIGSNYVVQVATNLDPPQWVPVLTNAAPFVFTDNSVQQFGHRFYRSYAR